MNLPVIDLPIPLSLELPFLIHPVFVHFAIVLPIAVLLIEVVNLLTKRKALSVSAYILLGLTIGIYLLTYLAGKSDASESFALLDEETQTLLKEHRNLGAYLLYFSVLPIIFKVLSLIKKSGMVFAYFFVLIFFIGATLFQGKEGGELVYEYGVNVRALEVKDDRIETLEDEIEELKESIEGLKEESNISVEHINDCSAEVVKVTPVFGIESNSSAVSEEIVSESNTSAKEQNSTIETNSSH